MVKPTSKTRCVWGDDVYTGECTYTEYPARGQQNTEINLSPSQIASDDLVLRDSILNTPA